MVAVGVWAAAVRHISSRHMLSAFRGSGIPVCLSITGLLLFAELRAPSLVLSCLRQAAYGKAVEEEDADVARGLCRVFTEMGEAYMDLIM